MSDEHFGIYAAWKQDGRVVTVRKARGPYIGWLDLPGGSQELGESHEDTLNRELMEECGVRVRAVHSWHPFDFHVRNASDGTEIDFRHRGVIALVDVMDNVAQIENVEDVRRVELIQIGDAVGGMSPPLLLVLSLLRL